MIRLSTAHAKCRLSHEVTTEDAQLAEEILLYSLYNDAKTIKKKQIKRKRQSENGTPSNTPFGNIERGKSRSELNDDIYYFNEEEEDERAERARSTIRRSQRFADSEPTAMEEVTETDHVVGEEEISMEHNGMFDETDKENTLMTDETINQVKEAIDKVTSEKMSEQCSLREVMTVLDKQGMEQDQVERCLNLLQGAGLIMYHDQIIFRI